MTTTPLSSLFYSHRGNISDKWEQYLAIYESELRQWQGKPVELLEIGVQNGGSMDIWARYFDRASSLVGIDIDERITGLAHEPNVELLVADGTSAAQVSAVLGARTFDVIIDDGSHVSTDIVNSLRLLFSRLKPGGRYFIEDLHCAYWSEFGGGLEHEGSAIEFLKKLVDVIHFDHLQTPGDLEIGVDDDLLLDLRTGLARVTFYDSVAVIERLPFARHEPYRRVLTGDSGEVVDPVQLVMLEEERRLLFVEPLARTVDSGLIEEIKAGREQLRLQAEDLHARIAAREAEVRALRESTSWKVTAPIRALRQLIPGRRRDEPHQ